VRQFFGEKSEIQTYFIQSHLQVPKHLCRNFLGFCPNFQEFVRIFDESKLFGVRLHPELLHRCHESFKILQRYVSTCALWYQVWSGVKHDRVMTN